MRLVEAEFIALKTPIGHLSLGFLDSRLVYVGTKRFNSYIRPLKKNHQEARQQLIEYFYEGRQQFQLPLYWSGTPFQQRAWEVLCTIPYGSRISYKEQAQKMGHPNVEDWDVWNVKTLGSYSCKERKVTLSNL